MEIDISSITSLLGILGLGSVLGQWLAGSSDRRTAKAEVLRALSQTETARWAGPKDQEEISFTEASRNLQAAALVARVPRLPLTEYLVCATAAYWVSVASWDEDQDPEFGGSISTSIANITKDFALLLADVVWLPPVMRRFRYQRRFRRLLTARDGISLGGYQYKLDRARRRIM